MNNYIIIANGNFLAKEIMLEAMQNKIVIALDGAAHKLVRLGMTPHIILGDFDSITEADKTYWGIEKAFADLSEDDLPYKGKHNVLIVPAKNQNFTDLSKAVRYCDAQHATSITIICALGGRIDHQEGAMRTLRREYKKDRPIIIHAEQQTLRFVEDETIEIEGEIGDKCGVIAFPEGEFSSRGLEYEVENFPLIFGFSENICNAFKQKKVTLNIKGEALIIMPPQLKAQRSVMFNQNEDQQ